MARPTQYPDFATSGTRTEPPAPTKAAGWLAGYTMPAVWQNWLQGLTGDWIRQLVIESDESAKLAGSQTFSGANAFTQPLNITTPSGDHAAWAMNTVASGVKWQHVGKMNSGVVLSGEYVEVRLYVGDGTEGWFAVAVNAYYRHASSQWRQLHNGAASHALIITSTGAKLWYQASGSADWTSWTTSGPLEAGDALFNGPIQADAFNSPSLLVSVPIPLGEAQGTTRTRVGSTGAIGVSSLAAVWWPLSRRFPVNSTWGDIQIVLNQSTSTPSVFEILRRDADGSAGGAPTHNVDHSVGSGAGTGRKVVTIPTDGYEYASGEDLELVWSPGDTSSQIEQIKMVNCTFRGPRNF